MKTIKSPDTNQISFVLMRDGFIIDGIFDTLEEADKVAKYNRRNYVGTWSIRRTANLGDFLHNSGVLKPTEDLELARAVRHFTRS